MPLLRSVSSSRLASAPLEWKAQRTFSVARTERDAAAERISRSGMQNHSKVASRVAVWATTADAPTFAANWRAVRRERGELRLMISVMVYPDSRRARAREVARLPAPTIASWGVLGTGGAYHCQRLGNILRGCSRFTHCRTGVSDPHASFSCVRRAVYLLFMTNPRSSKAKKARVISSRVSYRGPVFSVTTDQVEEPGGIRARRDVVRHSGPIVVLAIEGRGADPCVLQERQDWHAAGQR